MIMIMIIIIIIICIVGDNRSSSPDSYSVPLYPSTYQLDKQQMC